MLHVNSDGGFWEKPSFRLAGVANERTNSGHAQREREALSWRIWRQSQSRTCHEIIIKTFLIVFCQIYTITYRLFKISTFNAFVKLTKAVTFLFVICQILSPMTNWRSASASPEISIFAPHFAHKFSVYLLFLCLHKIFPQYSGMRGISGKKAVCHDKNELAESANIYSNSFRPLTWVTKICVTKGNSIEPLLDTPNPITFMIITGCMAHDRFNIFTLVSEIKMIVNRLKNNWPLDLGMGHADGKLWAFTCHN